MLPDLHLLDGLTERRSVTGSVLSGDSDLLGALGLEERREEGTQCQDLTRPKERRDTWLREGDQGLGTKEGRTTEILRSQR